MEKSILLISFAKLSYFYVYEKLKTIKDENNDF